MIWNRDGIIWYSKDEVESYKQSEQEGLEIIAELKAENERLKTQYNCYACGNCKGKEDYINLEKHHKGLRKQKVIVFFAL